MGNKTNRLRRHKEQSIKTILNSGGVVEIGEINGDKCNKRGTK